MDNLIGSGDIVNYTTTGNVTKGVVRAYGSDLVGVAAETATTGALVALHLQGEYSVTTKRAAASEGWSVGSLIYLSATGALTPAVTGQAAGIATAASATGATTGQLIINRGFAA